MKKRILYTLVISILFSIALSCQERKGKALEIPFERRISDSVGLLTIDQKNNLFGLIKDLDSTVGAQIAIVIIDTLGGKQINDVSLAVGEKLNLGRQKYRDGLLIFFSYKDHKVRIEVGYGLERIIKDEIASRIIREKIKPRFKKQEYYEGFSAAILEINELIKENKELIGKYH
jgi:uncharacterized protein